MRLLFYFTSILCFSSQPIHGQAIYPDLPEQDYAIYTAIVNEFPNCSDTAYAYRQNKLRFIHSTTEEKSPSGFRFDFAKAQQELAHFLRPQSLIHREPTFYKDLDWQRFLASVDSSSFSRHTLSRTIDAQCQQTALWTDEKEQYYFSKETYRKRGFYALRNDYDNFGGIVRFSKVAYSEDATKAICYYSEITDGKAGAGYLLFLGKWSNGWKILGKAMLWIV